MKGAARRDVAASDRVPTWGAVVEGVLKAGGSSRHGSGTARARALDVDRVLVCTLGLTFLDCLHLHSMRAGVDVSINRNLGLFIDHGWVCAAACLKTDHFVYSLHHMLDVCDGRSALLPAERLVLRRLGS